MNTVLITGGAGFLGSHLCSHMLNCELNVICIDNYQTGSWYNIAPLLDHDNFKFLPQDITHSSFCTFIAETYGSISEIYNLACPASPPHYQSDPVQTIKTNVYGAVNVLDLAKCTDSKIFQASTSEVYGDPEVHPQPEEYVGHVNPIGPRACYDEGKRCAEALFFDYHRKYRIRIKVARIFNTYGPHMHPEDGRVISNLIVQALQGQDVTVFGDGSQTRSFCYVDDLVEGICKLMNSRDSITGPINLGNPEEITIRKLAELVIELTNSKSRIIYTPLPVDDPRQRNPDISKASELLGWKPRIRLRQGLEETINYFDSRLSKVSCLGGERRTST